MKTKLINTVFGAIAAALLFGIMYNPTISQASNHIRPTGKTTQQSSQLVLWYDEDEIDEDNDSFIQVTNASVDTPVWVHVQIFASTCLNFKDNACAPADLVLCSETNFNDFFTPNDTHVYVMENVKTNDPFLVSPLVVGNFDGTKGFVVVTPIDGPGTRKAISHQHMFGTSFVFNDDEELGFGVSSMGRDAVSFPSGVVEDDGTILDGVTNGYVLIQPKLLMFTFDHQDELDTADLISIAFRDNYEGVFGYVAEPADATWTPLIFDDEENPISCGAVEQDCFFNIGLNSLLDPINDLLNPVDDFSICPNNNINRGFMKIAVGGLEGLENEMAIVLQADLSDEEGVASWMYGD
ncbi:MAG: hypothetical protein IH874_01720 [Candidatus Dadabacteria bacterium]|nr:hypothetical protein [Candidatus Dadabacteria bacterium]